MLNVEEAFCHMSFSLGRFSFFGKKGTLNVWLVCRLDQSYNGKVSLPFRSVIKLRVLGEGFALLSMQQGMRIEFRRTFECVVYVPSG